MSTCVYADFILKNVPRAITQIDRDPHSPTYGSCDRNFWHLKIRDFSSAILQQNCLTLSLLYSVDFEGNLYYQNENIKNWAEASVYFWGGIQLKDGSFNEYYPHEHGFPPTAFSLFGVCETYKRLGMKDNKLLAKFEKTARYLVSHIESQALNQEIASITALFSVYSLTGSEWIRKGLDNKLERVLSLQTKEGWFPEYGGADLGYLSVSLDMLAEYYIMSHDTRMVEPIHRMIGFIKYFVHPDSTVGGEYGSRNTTYFLPFGIEAALTLENRDAAAIKERLYCHSMKDNPFFMDAVDDRYITHYVIHSFLRAMVLEKQSVQTVEPTILPCFSDHCRYFDESGMVSITEDRYHAIVSLKKGGVIKLWNSDREMFADCGYRVNYGNGRVAATNWIDPDYQYNVSEKTMDVSGKMNLISLKVPSPALHAGLRIVSFFLGSKIIGFLKKTIIFVDKHTNVTFKRSISFEDEHVYIADFFESPDDFCLVRACNMSLRHVASGKFFAATDLMSQDDTVFPCAKKIRILTDFSIHDGRTLCRYEKLE